MAVKMYQRVAVAAKPPSAVGRIVRKIALFGSHGGTLTDAPWDDPSWEKWGHASSRACYARSMDRYFDLHPRATWTRRGKDGPAYLDWLSRNTVPIYMQKRHPDVPASIEFPRRRILAEYGDPRPYFTNHAAWMIALAMTEGVSTLGLWGISYSARSEYAMQRGCCEHWLGRAAAAGIRIILPEQCTLLREPSRLYGYESHDDETGLLTTEYKEKQRFYLTGGPAQPDTRSANPPSELLGKIAEEELARPDWARNFYSRSNGKVIEGVTNG